MHVRNVSINVSLIWVVLRFQYKIPKKEEIAEQQQQEPDNPLMRKKKTPEELAAEAELEDQDEFTSEFLLRLVSYALGD